MFNLTPQNFGRVRQPGRGLHRSPVDLGQTRSQRRIQVRVQEDDRADDGPTAAAATTALESGTSATSPPPLRSQAGVNHIKIFLRH